MNFLGHLYLAGSNPQMRLGNFIADHIKSIPLTEFPPLVARGIMMHRAIDYFTDTHPALMECRAMLRKGYRKYAGVVLDVLMDFFLADNWNRYSQEPLKPFIFTFYMQLVRQWDLLPPYWKERLPDLIRDDRIGRYRTIDGICESLEIMARTTSLPSASQSVRELVETSYDEIDRRVAAFIPDVVLAMQQQFDIVPVGWPKRGL